MSFTPKESTQAQREFSMLSPETQAQIRKAQAEEYERKQTGLEKVKAYAEMEEVKKRFVNLLGDRDGRAYVESVVIAVANSDNLQQCTPKSIMISAMRAASLKLSVDPILKQAHLVPMGKEATLIVDYHGLVQLSTNTGYYEVAPNVFEVYEGEEVKLERFSGKVEILGERISDKVIGWCGYFKAKNGSERYLYMTNEECDAHGKKYSKAYNSPKSGWNTDREKMRRKTVLRLLVSRWGNFSPHVQNVIMQDEPTIEAETFDLPSDDNIVIPEKQHRPEEEILREMGVGN
jgi:recombination protein RecT